MATRDITTAAKTAAVGQQVTLLCFVECDFPSGFVRVTNAPFDVTWNSATWKGVGALGQVQEVKEVLGLEATGHSFTLSGIDSTKIATALGENYQGRTAKMWIGFIAAGAIVADPFQALRGRMDTMPIRYGKTATVTVNVENRLAAWGRAKYRRFADADQQAEFPGDLGLQYVTEMASGKEVRWGTN